MAAEGENFVSTCCGQVPSLMNGLVSDKHAVINYSYMGSSCVEPVSESTRGEAVAEYKINHHQCTTDEPPQPVSSAIARLTDRT